MNTYQSPQIKTTLQTWFILGNQRSEHVFILVQFFSFQIKKTKQNQKLTDKAHQSVRGPGSDIIQALSTLIKSPARSQISNDLLRLSEARVFLLQYIHLQSENKQPHTSFWELDSVAITTQSSLQRKRRSKTCLQEYLLFSLSFSIRPSNWSRNHF